MYKLSSIYQHKVSILTRQLHRVRLNQTLLEDALQRAKSSIQSPSDVQFLLSRSDIVSTLGTEKSYSGVLVPEAQFLPEFTKNEVKRMVRNWNFDFSYPCISLWPGKRLSSGAILFSEINNPADTFHIAVVIYPGPRRFSQWKFSPRKRERAAQNVDLGPGQLSFIPVHVFSP